MIFTKFLIFLSKKQISIKFCLFVNSLRDKYLCQVCLKNNIYTYNNLQIHHIIPINIDYSKRLDSDNLITLCTYHHHQAEKGLITREQLLEIIFFSTPTAHLNSHNYKFSVIFLENITNKRVLE